MQFKQTPIPGVQIIQPDILGDERGFFTESYRRSVFTEQGIEEEFVQDNHSYSSKGTLRGLHFQVSPFSQSKLVRVVAGEIFDVAVDMRKESKTFGHWHGEHLSAENYRMLYIPQGFAHGFLVLKENTQVLYKTSNYYSAPHERGIMWNDPAIGIEWPDLGMDYIISNRDHKHPGFTKQHDFTFDTH